jgi:hypothetical protein
MFREFPKHGSPHVLILRTIGTKRSGWSLELLEWTDPRKERSAAGTLRLTQDRLFERIERSAVLRSKSWLTLFQIISHDHVPFVLLRSLSRRWSTIFSPSKIKRESALKPPQSRRPKRTRRTCKQPATSPHEFRRFENSRNAEVPVRI